MPWWCDKHKQHSCDDVCWKCDNDHDQPYIDAFNAGWNARNDVDVMDDYEVVREHDLHKWKADNQDLLLRRMRGTHE